MRVIDLDANATTPVLPAALAAMQPWFSDHPGNPSSEHRAGRLARAAVDTARAQVAGLIGARAEEIIFSSGGTECINSVHHFARREWPDRPLLITSAAEHAAGMECAARWRQEGGQVKTIPVTGQGVLDLEALRQAVEPGRTALVSMIWGNNETGVIAPMHEIVEIAHAAGAPVHADAVQMAGKAPLNVADVPVDYLSLSGHKFHGPKGVGALFVRQQARFRPLLVGGGQEHGMRSGTENVAGIVGMGAAAAAALQGLPDNSAQMTRLRDLFESLLRAEFPEIVTHSAHAPRLPNTSSLCFPGVDAAGLLILLDERGIACSGGSACHSASLHPSHVLEAMGFDARHAASTVRFSLSVSTTEADIRTAAAEAVQAVTRLRAMRDLYSPVSFA